MSSLAEITGLDVHDLKKRLDWWVSKGFLLQGPLDPISLEETFCLTTSTASIENYIRQAIKLILT